MKTKFCKKAVAFIVASVMTISLIPASVFANWTKNENQQWTYTENGNAIIGWKNINNNWYYFNSNGIMQTGWNFIDSEWYYLNSNGAMKIGWLKENNTWYYLRQSGAMARNWAEINGNWYFFAPNGAMQTGLVEIKGEKYYFDKNGVMQTGDITVNGQKYYFDKTNGNMVVSKDSSVTETKPQKSSGSSYGGGSGSSAGNSSSSNNPENTLTSEEAIKPRFVQNLPKKVTVTEGEKIELSIAVNSVNGTLSYQWYKDDIEISGATSPTYIIEEATILDSGVYKVLATNKSTSNSKFTFSKTCVLKVTPDLSHSPALDYADNWYKSKDIDKSEIATIEIVDIVSDSVVENTVESWNSGINNGDDVKCYITGEENNYTLTISGNGSGKIYLIGAEKTFKGFTRATRINGLDLLDTSNATDMHYMFLDCNNVKALDVSNFDTSNVTNMMSMFSACSSLSNIDVTNFDTSNVTNMRSMFHSCTGLNSLDLSSFETDSSTDAWRLAANCPNLSTVTLSDSFKADSILMFFTESLKNITVYGANDTMKSYNWKDNNRIVTFN